MMMFMQPMMLATTESGQTPLHVASIMGCMNIIIFLIQHQANPDEATVRGETLLNLADRANQTDIIRSKGRRQLPEQGSSRLLTSPPEMLEMLTLLSFAPVWGRSGCRH